MSEKKMKEFAQNLYDMDMRDMKSMLEKMLDDIKAFKYYAVHCEDALVRMDGEIFVLVHLGLISESQEAAYQELNKEIKKKAFT